MRGQLSNSRYLSQLNPRPPLTFLTPTHQATMLTLLVWHSFLVSEAAGAGRGLRVALLKCYFKCVNLFHVFYTTGILCSCAQHAQAHHNLSCSLQTIRELWTYFKSVCLDWQDTSLQLSTAYGPSASKIALYVKTGFVSRGFFLPSWHQVNIVCHIYISFILCHPKEARSTL